MGDGIRPDDDPRLANPSTSLGPLSFDLSGPLLQRLSPTQRKKITPVLIEQLHSGAARRRKRTIRAWYSTIAFKQEDEKMETVMMKCNPTL
ncbi:hypothetical protein FNV43_RR20178 [Rhamnella rubrinervis]|uniref:Uncharacterized protein n=1 Tax=Rhamnella rubrinervis TaxID=2594499 RepID=A0A8K0GWU4_9ROSA|nr:hypothetical protein FNV43_RR20178 [Rhamnella rubrinervis]